MLTVDHPLVIVHTVTTPLGGHCRCCLRLGCRSRQWIGARRVVEPLPHSREAGRGDHQHAGSRRRRSCRHDPGRRPDARATARPTGREPVLPTPGEPPSGRTSLPPCRWPGRRGCLRRGGSCARRAGTSTSTPPRRASGCRPARPPLSGTVRPGAVLGSCGVGGDARQRGRSPGPPPVRRREWHGGGPTRGPPRRRPPAGHAGAAPP